MCKAFKDAGFHREYKKLTGEDSDPLTPEEMAIREMPRDAEVIELLKQFSKKGRFRAITAKEHAARYRGEVELVELGKSDTTGRLSKTLTQERKEKPE